VRLRPGWTILHAILVATSPLRSVFRRDIMLPCIVIFLCDIVWNIMSPTLSIYAQSIGATLPFIGVLNSVTGLGMLIFSVPAGVYGDRAGRKRMMMIGTLIFAVACIAHAVAPSAEWLTPGRILFAIGTVSTFPIGAAYIVDVTHPRERGIAFGLLTTAMSIGSTVGALLAAVLEGPIGIRGTHLVGAAAAALGFMLAALLLRRTNAPSPNLRPGLPYATMLPLLKNPRIALACMVQLLISICFTGVIMPFFPLLAQARGASSPEVSSMFSLRAFGSMLTRLPFGMLSNRVPRATLMMIALACLCVAVFAMGGISLVPILAALLVVEGIAFGLNLTVGQAAVTEGVGDDERGAAIGLHGTAGSIGSTLSPLLLGALAGVAGIAAVFQITTALALAALIVAWLTLGRRKAEA
jgi:MFS family permease